MRRAGPAVLLLTALALGVEGRAEGIELIAFGPPAPHRDIGLAWRRASSRALEFGELGATLKEIFGACSPRW